MSAGRKLREAAGRCPDWHMDGKSSFEASLPSVSWAGRLVQAGYRIDTFWPGALPRRPATGEFSHAEETHKCARCTMPQNAKETHQE
jgi:hypothetical protein